MKTIVHTYLDKQLQNLMSPEVKIYYLTQWYNKMRKFIPYETGILRDNIVIDKNGITFLSNQAHYLYVGMLRVGELSRSSWAKKDEKKVLTNKPLQFSHEQSEDACAEWGKVAMDLYSDVLARELKKVLYRKG